MAVKNRTLTAFGVLVAAGFSLLGLGASSAAAEMLAPVWSVRAVVAPASLPPGGAGEVIVTVTDLGDAAAHASSTEPIKVSAELPAGVTATSIEDYEHAVPGSGVEHPVFVCEARSLVCEASSGTVLMYESLEIVIHVAVAGNAHSGPIGMLVSGGGATPVSVSDPVSVSSAATKFGLERFEMWPLNADGSLDTQAGSHPFQFTATVAFNQGAAEQETETSEVELAPEPLALPKDETFNLPPGLIGNPAAVPQCPLREFQGGSNGEEDLCPADTQVGVVSVVLSFGGTSLDNGYPQPTTFLAQVYNLVPSVGEPARFGFTVASNGTVPVFLDTSVRTGGDYGVVVSVDNINQEVTVVGAQLSFWGDPGNPLHDLARGKCLHSGEFGVEGCERVAVKPAPFLTLPASCSGLSDPFTAGMEATSWAAPAVEIPSTYVLRGGAGEPVELDGCNRLPFDPSIGVAPDSQSGSTSTGLTTNVHVPQAAALNPEGLAESSVKDISVTLPEGVALNPSGADELEACSESLVGFTGSSEFEAGTQTLTFSSRLPEPLEQGVDFCPDASKIGTVRIVTPLLAGALEGAVYLASQDANPFGSLVAMYLVAEDASAGVLVKLPGEVSLNQDTGQITATFKDSPQLPFEDAELHFFGGERAPLASPSHCGAYTTNAAFTPWSGNPPAESSSTFDIVSGPSHTACPGASLPFSPSLTAGATSIQAGGFSPFEMTMSREDGEQSLQGVQLKMPLGMSGTLSNVELCGEEQANAGTCGPESLIGETIVSVGVGSEPFTVTGGKVYITGPYRGAPFGLSIVNPAKAGPFDLGQVVVRAKIEVDPITAALTITTDTEGPYKIPTIIDGIPLQVKHVNVDVDRPGFTFNPTNCSPLAITGTLGSAEGSTDTLSVPFQVTNCAVLAFKPRLTVSTSGKTSRANGASLTVKLGYPAGPYDANIARVKVELPKALPSRLTTLQKACTAAVFESNPAACPPASIVGHATATTPELPVPLSGPAYFVSHGGEAFPSLIIVLQGYGVTVHLVGSTFINKAGITSSTFKTVPDAPVGTFELTLPMGRYSALAANGDLCKTQLAMPTEFVGQNGAEIHESTKIEVTGCAKAKKASKKKAHRKAKHKHKRKRG